MHEKIIKLIASRNYLIFFLLGLMSKFNENMKRIHYFSHLKSCFINCNILKKFNTLKYAYFNEIIAMIIKKNREIIFMKKNLVGIFDHMFVAENN